MEEMQNALPTRKGARAPYVGFSLRQRLLPVILLAAAAGLTVCFFGPFDIYRANVDEFRFPLESFFGYHLLWTLGVAVLLTGILLPLRGRVFDIAYAVLLWVTLMLFIQGNYLNFNINNLAGDGMGDDGMGVWNVVINTAVWLLVGAGFVLAAILLRGAAREWIPTVGVIAMVTVIGMQAVPFAVNSLATDIWERNHSTTLSEEESKEHFLTYRNMDKVSSNKNIIYFVIDRFDNLYYDEHGMVDCPELFEGLDGFTYFDDMVSLYPRTFPSIPYMLTGMEHDFHDNRVDYFREAYQASPFLKALKSNGYKVNIYSDSYYAYNDASQMGVENSSQATSFTIAERGRLAGDMLRISWFRYLPHLTKGWVGDIATSDFDKYVVYVSDYPKYTTDMRKAYEFLGENQLTTFDGANSFTFIHLSGCHMPTKYTADFGEAKTTAERNDHTSALKQSFAVINRYLDGLKALGLYEDATIIITGDHGWHGGSDSEIPIRRAQTTALFFKPSGSAGTPLVTNRAPVAQGDIIPTIVESAGLESTHDFGRTLFEYREGEERVRRFNFQGLRTVDGKIDYEQALYEIRGRAREFKNWVLVERGEMIGNIYQ